MAELWQIANLEVELESSYYPMIAMTPASVVVTLLVAIPMDNCNILAFLPWTIVCLFVCFKPTYHHCYPTSYFFCLFVWGSHPLSSGLTPGSILLAKFRGRYGMPGIKLGLAACKASIYLLYCYSGLHILLFFPWPVKFIKYSPVVREWNWGQIAVILYLCTFIHQNISVH